MIRTSDTLQKYHAPPERDNGAEYGMIAARVWELGHALARKLNAIRDPAIRRRALARSLGELAPRDAVAALGELIDAYQRAPTSALAEALVAVAGALTEPDVIGYELRAQLHSAARELARGDVARLMYEGRALAELVDDNAAEERPLAPRGRPLSLGERKALARGHRRDILAQLLRDPHPDVVRMLLGNPHITERDVLQIATRRPAPPAALAVVANFDRWIVRRLVKRALVLNPYTPAIISVRLAITLLPADLREIAEDGNLAGPVRTQARELLARGPD
jgi:hypothetical protein